MRVVNAGKVLSTQHAGGTNSWRHCQQQIKTKYELAIYMLKETAENGVLLKEYRCVHAFQVKYG